MEVSCTWLELVVGDMLLGWRWDANIGIWMEARCNKEVGRSFMDIARGETVHRWRWDKNLVICSWYSTGILGWRWKARITFLVALRWSWIELRCNFRELDVAETSHGLRWDTDMRTCIRVRHDLDGGEMWIQGAWKEMEWDIKGGEHYIPKLGYEWYGTCWATTFRSWMEGTLPVWKWDTNIGTRLYVKCKSRGLGRLQMILHLYIAPGWR